MSQVDFCNDTKGRGFDFRLNNWTAAVRVAFGVKAWLVFLTACAAVLMPSLLIASYSLFASRPALLLWAALGLLGFWHSSTGPTGLGIVVSMIIASMGFVMALTLHDWLFFVCGVVPGATWFASCAILGTTASYLIDRLCSSESLFQTLISRGILTSTKASNGSRLP